MNARALTRRNAQAGLAAIEFALVAGVILIPLLFGMMEFGRVTFYWNAATEATRLGARLAVVCDLDDSTIKSRMNALFPVVEPSDIDITYLPAGCTATTCTQVEVSISPSTPVQTYIPYFGFTPNFPPFSTTLPRESMRSAFGPAGAEVANPVCE